MTKETLFRLIDSKALAVLGSVSPDGKPQSALVGIAVTPELEIIFDTVNTSRKYRNLLQDPEAALVIGWENEITVQYEGLARELGSAELTRYHEVYFARWPECRAHLTWASIAYFVVKPRWIRYSDFNEGSRCLIEMEF